MINLLQETLKALESNKKTPEDVLWCGNDKIYFTWQEFEKIANVDYDNGYGGNEVNSHLVIVGADFWLERGEYDGSEWWEFKTMPQKPLMHKKVSTVITGWDSL